MSTNLAEARSGRAPRLALAAAVLLALPLAPAAHADDLSFEEREFIANVRKAKEDVRRLEAQETQRGREKAAKRKALEDAEHVVLVKSIARRIRRAHIAGIKERQIRQTESLESNITRVKLDLKYAQKDLAGATTDAERRKYRQQVLMAEANLRILQRQLERLRKQRDFAGELARAEAAYKRADDEYWDARRAALAPGREYWEAGNHLDYTLERLGEARDRLAKLRVDAPRILARVAPPYLLRVRATEPGGSTVYYEAAWIDAAEQAKKEIEVCNRMLAEHRGLLKKFRAERDGLLDDLIDADRRWQDLNREYIRRIWHEAFGRIGLETLDTALSVLWSNKGNWGVNLAFETVWRGGKFAKWYFGGDSPYFSFPQVQFDPDDVTMRGAAARSEADAVEKLKRRGVWAGGKVLKSTIKTAVQQIAKNRGAIAEAAREYSLWAAVQGHLASQMTSGKMRPESFRWANATLRFATGQRRAALKSLYGQVWNSKFRSSLAKSLGKTAIKTLGVEAGKAWLKSRRAEIFQQMYHVDKEWRGILAEMKSASRQLQIEKNKIKAIEEVREELLAELEGTRGKRTFELIRNEIVKDTGDGAELHLTFSRPVKRTKVTLGGRALEVRGTGKDLRGTVELSGLPELAELVVDANDLRSEKRLDSDASTKAAYVAGEERWLGWEPGADRDHRLKLKPMPDGVSLVFLFDCSGSMSDKITEAKQSARRILGNKSLLGKNDEVAVWCFVGGTARLVVPFTIDRGRTAAAIGSLTTGGGTPLAASITRAGSYLVTGGRLPRKVLVVLSDGEETAGGNPELAIELVRRMAARVRKEGW